MGPSSRNARDLLRRFPSISCYGLAAVTSNGPAPLMRCTTTRTSRFPHTAYRSVSSDRGWAARWSTRPRFRAEQGEIEVGSGWAVEVEL